MFFKDMDEANLGYVNNGCMAVHLHSRIAIPAATLTST